MLPHATHRENGVIFDWYHKFQQEGIKPSRFMYPGILKSCGSIGATGQGHLIHDCIIQNGIESDVVIGSTLVDMYAKCGSLEESCNVFNRLPYRNIVSWGAMIAGYTQHGKGVPALQLLKNMQLEGIEPDKVIFSCSLKACGSIEASSQGKLIHDQIIRSGVESDVVIGSTLVDMYAKCGSLEVAREVFDRIPNRNLVSWSAMISGYVHHGYGACALELFDKMHQEGMKPNNVVFPSIFKACGIVGDLKLGEQMHDLVGRLGLASDVVVGNSLVDMYAKCGALEEALIVFDCLPHRNVVSYGAIIMGYVQQGHIPSALGLFKEMQQDGIKPNNVMFSCILKACGSSGRLEQGKLIHEHIVKSEQGSDVVIASSLIDMYAKCGSLKDAHKLFNELQIPNVVSWGAMISGYVEHGQPLRCLELFAELPQQGVEPNRVMFPCILKACGITGAFQQGKLVHDQIMRSGLETDVVVGSSVVDMYTKCGSLEEAHKVFDKMPHRDVVSWGAMIIGYVQQEHDLPALQLFDDMQQQGIEPNEVIFPCILKACGSSGALLHGKLIHNVIIRSGLESCSVIGNNLIDLYTSCGSLADAHRAFDELPLQDVVSWGALIVGYAQQGNYRLVGQCLEDMQRQGLKPDGCVYATALSACSHAGQVAEGQSYFKSMIQDHGITPSIEHFNCLVDLLGRAGCLEEAKQLLQIMPVLPDIVGWTALLTACRTYGNKELEMECLDQVVLFDHDVIVGHACMSSLYADALMWEEVNMVQELEIVAGSWKKPGRAWIEVESKVHEFIVGDKTHPNSYTIDSSSKRLKGLIRKKGYVPQVGVVFEPGFD